VALTCDLLNLRLPLSCAGGAD